MKICILFLFTVFLSCAGAAKNLSVYYPDTGESSDFAAMLEQAPLSGHVIMGEFHYDKNIQEVEAKIINELTKLRGLEGQITVGWEFLNHTDQQKIQKLSRQVAAGEIDPQTFLDSFFDKPHQEYLPLIQTIQKSQAKIVGLNVPRLYKQKLIREGMQALPTHIIPPNMEVGGALYRERFEKAMGGHVPADMLERYFEAQCLTDSAMAHVSSKEEKRLNFLVAGSFHTDYFMGTTARLMKLGSADIYLIKIINKKKLKDDEIEKIKEIHPDYGPIADAIVIID